MNSLDSPLEALALNYLSFGFLTAANNVWAWIAVITAAVSVWRIRASSPLGKSLNVESSLSTGFSSPTAAPSSSSSSSEVERVAAEPTEVEVSVPSTSAVSVFQTEGKTSGKFSVYYRDEEEEEEEGGCGNDESNDDIDSVEDSLCSIEGLGNGWEVTMKMRVNDMGWHHYQDLTVLDGNVVRLWDGCRRRNAAPLSMSCGGARW